MEDKEEEESEFNSVIANLHLFLESNFHEDMIVVSLMNFSVSVMFLSFESSVPIISQGGDGSYKFFGPGRGCEYGEQGFGADTYHQNATDHEQTHAGGICKNQNSRVPILVYHGFKSAKDPDPSFAEVG